MINFDRSGFVVVESIFSISEIDAIVSDVECLKNSTVGGRNLLSKTWCAEIGEKIRRHPEILPLLSEEAVIVQCTYFNKSEKTNWSVALHRDQFIPVKYRADTLGWSAWSKKEGVNYVRPPSSVLASMVSVRLHLDECMEGNGPLEVIAGSHIDSEMSADRTICYVRRGDVLVFKPLLLHGSSKVAHGQRRILHYLYGPKCLPDNMEWPDW